MGNWRTLMVDCRLLACRTEWRKLVGYQEKLVCVKDFLCEINFSISVKKTVLSSLTSCPVITVKYFAMQYYANLSVFIAQSHMSVCVHLQL